MNKVVLIGRLTKDPEIRYTNGENSMAVARYTLAVERRTKRDADQKADFISCVAFGKPAEFAEKYLHQGIKVAVSGRIQTGSYTNREGRKVYTMDVVVEECEFAESKNANQNQNENQRSQESGMSPYGGIPSDGFMNIPDGIDDELPFN